MDKIYENIDEYISNRKRKILIVIDDKIAKMISNKKNQPIVTELFLRGKILNISLVLIKVLFCQENIRPNSTFYFLVTISNKKETQHIVF